jgi:hypothetical protein
MPIRHCRVSFRHPKCIYRGQAIEVCFRATASATAPAVTAPSIASGLSPSKLHANARPSSGKKRAPAPFLPSAPLPCARPRSPKQACHSMFGIPLSLQERRVTDQSAGPPAKAGQVTNLRLVTPWHDRAVAGSSSPAIAKRHRCKNATRAPLLPQKRHTDGKAAGKDRRHSSKVSHAAAVRWGGSAMGRRALLLHDSNRQPTRGSCVLQKCHRCMPVPAFLSHSAV